MTAKQFTGKIIEHVAYDPNDPAWQFVLADDGLVHIIGFGYDSSPALTLDKFLTLVGEGKIRCIPDSKYLDLYNELITGQMRLTVYPHGKSQKRLNV